MPAESAVSRHDCDVSVFLQDPYFELQQSSSTVTAMSQQVLQALPRRASWSVLKAGTKSSSTACLVSLLP